jgi:hypothetical protein
VEGRALACWKRCWSALAAEEGYQATGVPFVFKLDRDFVIRRVWEEATGAVPAAQVPVRPVK